MFAGGINSASKMRRLKQHMDEVLFRKDIVFELDVGSVFCCGALLSSIFGLETEPLKRDDFTVAVGPSSVRMCRTASKPVVIW